MTYTCRYLPRIWKKAKWQINCCLLQITEHPKHFVFLLTLWPCCSAWCLWACVHGQSFGNYSLSRYWRNYMYYIRNRKNVPCFYQVIETQVKLLENKKCCGNMSRRRVFPQLFRVLPNFCECFYNSIETQRTCFLFIL